MVLLLVFMQLTRDLFAIAKFLSIPLFGQLARQNTVTFHDVSSLLYKHLVYVRDNK